jgi:hypothetical protein
MGGYLALIASASSAGFTSSTSNGAFTIRLHVFFKRLRAVWTGAHFMVIQIDALIRLDRLTTGDESSDQK